MEGGEYSSGPLSQVGHNGRRLGAAVRRQFTAFFSGERYTTDSRASREQQAYADLLDLGMKAGLAGMVVCFLLYVSGIVAPYVPLEDLPRYWSMPVQEYLAAAKVPTGWGWTRLAAHGDYLSIVPVAFLSTITIGCYLRILPMLSARGERIFSAIVVAEVAVLLLAASGYLAGGH